MKVVLLVLLPLLLCAFAPEGEGEGEPEFKRVFKQKDNTDDIIKDFTSAKSLVPHAIAIHDDPQAGQYWETGSESNDIGTTSRWQVTKVDGGRALIEQRLTLSCEMFKYDYVLAYRIELKPEPGKPQVTSAWVGKAGEKPQEAFVRDFVAPVKPTGEEPKGEDFADLELAGKKWAGKLFTETAEGMTTKIWVADGGWFGGTVKVTVDEDYEDKLTALGTDARALMEWPEDVLK